MPAAVRGHSSNPNARIGASPRGTLSAGMSLQAAMRGARGQTTGGALEAQISSYLALFTSCGPQSEGAVPITSGRPYYKLALVKVPTEPNFLKNNDGFSLTPSTGSGRRLALARRSPGWEREY